MQLHIYKDTKEFSHALADWVTDYITETLKKQDRFVWVLSGGNTPRALYELLANPPYREKIQWEKLHLFWGDERAVPFEDL
jgi:6-phosphogluconolactonase